MAGGIVLKTIFSQLDNIFWYPNLKLSVSNFGNVGFGHYLVKNEVTNMCLYQVVRNVIFFQKIFRSY